MSMDESRYLRLAHDAFNKVIQAFDEIDSDDADVDTQGDVVSIRFRDGTRVILNTQRPTQQLWLAGRNRAWHFDYDEASATWKDDKAREELFATLRALSDAAGLVVPFARETAS